MADIKIIDPETNEVKKEDTPQEIRSENGISPPSSEALEQDAVAKVTGIESDELKHRYKEDINTLLEWVKGKVKNPSRETIKWQLRQLEMKLGSPPLAERKISYLARFAYLESEGLKIEREKKLFKEQAKKKFNTRGF